MRHRFLKYILPVLLVITGCGQAVPEPTTTSAAVPTFTSVPTFTPTPAPILLRGLAYSPYRDCQSSDTEDQPTRDEILQDLEIISGMANGIRTYSSTGINAEIPSLARQFGMQVSAGAWLGRDRDANEREIEGLIQLAQTVDLESVIVGNEVLLREDLSEDELLDYIRRVRSAVDVPVTTAEIGGILLQHPRLMEAVDYQLVHLYPFWEGSSIEGAARLVADQYRGIQSKSAGKRVVIGETGWPSGGPSNGAAVPSPENQARFAREFLSLAQAESIEFYYFGAFDEMWKYEGGVGPYWGLLYVDRTFKYGIRSVMTTYDVLPSTAGSSISPPATPHPTPQGDENTSGAFPVYSDFEAPANHFSPGGWMGDIESMGFQCSTEGQTWPATVLRISYAPREEDELGWAGIYWLEPDQNWGTVPDAGYDLSPYRQLVFQARAEIPGTQIKFFLGGVSTSPAGDPLPFPSSITSPVFVQEADPLDGFVNLTDTWQEYHFDLSGLDLQHVIDGFGWAAERARTPQGAVFHLDNIRFVPQEPGPASLPPIHIYSGEFLRNGLDMGVASSGGLDGWVEDLKGAMKISYAAWQDWGVVYVSVGSAGTAYGYRSSMDLSAYSLLSVEMKGEHGGEIVYIGIKDRNQPDNGGEKKVKVVLGADWETYTFDLQQFYPGEIFQRIYIPIEFVFEPTIDQDEVIYFRNVQYLP